LFIEEGGGGGGGATAGEACPVTRIAACMARLGADPFVDDGDVGGGGGWERDGAPIGGRGAADGGGGGAVGGAGAEEDGGGSGGIELVEDGFRAVTGGGGGFLPIGGGIPRYADADDAGLWFAFKGVLRRFASGGMTAGVLEAFAGAGRGIGGTAGAGAVGGLGIIILGGLGAELRDVSGSDVYNESRFAKAYQFTIHFETLWN
jgi:hypothetical protein